MLPSQERGHSPPPPKLGFLFWSRSIIDTCRWTHTLSPPFFLHPPQAHLILWKLPSLTHCPPVGDVDTGAPSGEWETHHRNAKKEVLCPARWGLKVDLELGLDKRWKQGGCYLEVTHAPCPCLSPTPKLHLDVLYLHPPASERPRGQEAPRGRAKVRSKELPVQRQQGWD